MMTVVSGVRSLDNAAPPNESRPDWLILRDTILVSIATSPGAFMATAAQIESRPPQFWRRELRFSTWAVVQRQDEILGIAAAKSPSATDLYASREEACFIESVWIAPEMRGDELGQRLVTYLIEKKRRVGVRKFYLWVFDHNTPAISLYKRMDFTQTKRFSDLPGGREIQFLREFDREVIITAEELKADAGERERDWARSGLTYRMLAASPDC